MNDNIGTLHTYLPPISLSETFKQLAGTLSIDPEHLDPVEVEHLFKKAIIEHDYWYDRSDDLRVYDKGRTESNIINEHIHRNKELHEIWKVFCIAKEAK